MSRTLYTDQTRKFPHTSIRGNKYKTILHEIDSNSTCVESMKNQTKGEIIISCGRALKWIRICGLKTRHQILDNESSEKYKEGIRASSMTYQNVPPDGYRWNISKQIIQFCKDHFIVVLSVAVATSPLHLRCQVIM